MRKQSAGVSGILLIKGKALVLRRSPRDSEPGYWEFPKGAVEFGEEPEAAVRRELLEETGLDTKVKRILGLNSWTYSKDDTRFHVVETIFELELEPGSSIDKVRLSGDHDSWRLVTPEELQSLEPMVKERRAFLLESLG